MGEEMKGSKNVRPIESRVPTLKGKRFKYPSSSWGGRIGEKIIVYGERRKLPTTHS